jgi:hypothetical protein
LLEKFLVGFFICYEVARGKVCEAPLSESRYRETGSLYRNFLPPKFKSNKRRKIKQARV